MYVFHFIVFPYEFILMFNTELLLVGLNELMEWDNNIVLL